jgi:pyruvate formate lyase activating enzyme
MPLKKAGLVKTSLINYPGKVAAVIFTPGCNLRCPFCHNPELIEVIDDSLLMPIPEILEYLVKRKTMLQGVCITGGEPLVHDDIGVLIDAIHSIGLSVKIDTNGAFPENLKRLKPDFIAMDIKTSPWNYSRVSPLFDERMEHNILASILYIQESGIGYEFRSTAAPGILTPEDMEVIAGLLRPEDPYVLAQYRPGRTLDPSFTKLPYAQDMLEEMLGVVSRKCPKARLRVQ